jgi:hypothetical protein
VPPDAVIVMTCFGATPVLPSSGDPKTVGGLGFGFGWGLGVVAVVEVPAAELLGRMGSALADVDDGVVGSAGTTTVIGAPRDDADAELAGAGPVDAGVAATGDGAAVVAVVQAVASSATASPAASAEPRTNRRIPLTRTTFDRNPTTGGARADRLPLPWAGTSVERR